MPELSPPNRSKKDLVHSIAKTTLASIPVFGAASAEFFQMVITPPLEARRQEWMEEVTNGLTKLQESELLNINTLMSNPVFIDAILHTSAAVIKTHNAEKKEALRNIVFNSAVNTDIDEALLLMFVNIINEMTGWHLKLLMLFSNPQLWFQKNNITPPSFSLSSNNHQLINTAFPELSQNEDFIALIIKDLETKGLANIPYKTMMSASGAWEKRTTSFGDEFLKYIAQPAKLVAEEIQHES